MEMITSSVLATASNDRTVYFWSTGHNALKLQDIKLNKFWEDITSIKSVSDGVFVTVDSAFNVFLWEYAHNKAKLLKHFKSSEQVEVQDICLLRNSDIDRDFCALILCKLRQKSKMGSCKVVLLDRYLTQVKEELCPEYFESTLFQTIAKKTDYSTSYKLKIVFEININDLDCSKHATILALNNRPTREHFIEFKFEFNVKWLHINYKSYQ